MRLGIRFGKFINEYIKSYGCFIINYKPLMFWHHCGFTHEIWIREWLVTFICSALAQIDEEEFKKCKSTIGYDDI